MASKALWALHFERNKGEADNQWTKRFYELDDLEDKFDRPYAPLHIDTVTMPGSWGLTDPKSNLEWHRMCEPIVINEDNIVTVFNFTEGQMGRALAKMNCFLKKVDPAESTGTSP